MRKIFSKNSTGKKVLFFFVLTNLVYVFMLIVTIPKVMQFANGMKLLDMLPGGYDFEYVNALFQVLGEEGRQAYLFKQIPVDMIYPILFAVSYSLLLAFFLRKLNKFNSSFFYLCIVPIVGGSADYLENTGIITMLIQYPDIALITAKITNVFSLVKSISTTISFMALLVVIIIVGIKYINGKKGKNSNS